MPEEDNDVICRFKVSETEVEAECAVGMPTFVRQGACVAVNSPAVA